jgi:hypothetical protein
MALANEECFVRTLSSALNNQNFLWRPASQHHRDALTSYLNTPVPSYGFHTSALEVSVDHEDGGVYEVIFTCTRPSKMNCWFIEKETGNELTIMMCPPGYAAYENARIQSGYRYVP